MYIMANGGGSKACIGIWGQRAFFVMLIVAIGMIVVAVAAADWEGHNIWMGVSGGLLGAGFLFIIINWIRTSEQVANDSGFLKDTFKGDYSNLDN